MRLPRSCYAVVSAEVCEGRWGDLWRCWEKASLTTRTQGANLRRSVGHLGEPCIGRGGFTGIPIGGQNWLGGFIHSSNRLGRGWGFRSLYYIRRFGLPIIKSGCCVLCFDLSLTLCVMLDDSNKMFDEVVPEAGYRLTGTREIDENSPPGYDYHPRYRHRRSEDLQNNQNSLLPRSERAQVNSTQARPCGCADADEEGIDVSDVEFPIGCP